MYKPAFTLLEILTVILLLGILISLTLRFINSSRQFSTINNTQRRSDVFSIYTAISQYREDNLGLLPAGINNNSINICQAGCTESSTQIDISTELIPYLRFSKIPVDPLQGGSILTGYTVYVNAQGRVVVSAPLAENNSIINTIQ